MAEDEATAAAEVDFGEGRNLALVVRMRATFEETRGS